MVGGWGKIKDYQIEDINVAMYLKGMANIIILILGSENWIRNSYHGYILVF